MKQSIATAALCFFIPAAAAAAEPFDVLYLSEVRPVVVRLHVDFDGKPLPQAWQRFVDAIFTRFDANKNGVIDGKEAAKLNPLLKLATGTNPGLSAAAALTCEEIGRALQKNNLGPLRFPAPPNPQQMFQPNFRRGGEPTADELDKALLELLDADKDGKLSGAELAAGIAILSKLDADENELLSMEEVTRRPRTPFFFQNGNAVPSGPLVELLPLSRTGADPTIARRMLARFGPKPVNGVQPIRRANFNGNFATQPVANESLARRLTYNEAKINPFRFHRFDQDGDGELDADELARFGQNAVPEVEIALRLGKRELGMKPAAVRQLGSWLTAYGLKASAGSHAEAAIDLPGIRLELKAPPAMSPAAVQAAFREQYRENFRTRDRDSNGYLEINEVRNDPLFGNDLFRLLDRDGDGKIFEKELEAALDEANDLVAAAAGSLLAIELSETTRGLFGVLDADGDGRISVRELRALPRLASQFDANENGKFVPAKLPRRFAAVLAPAGADRFATQQFTRFGEPMKPPRPQLGPRWFYKMDRNRDGDVSRREFLGTDAEFRKLDADGDGLISAEEAEAAK